MNEPLAFVLGDCYQPPFSCRKWLRSPIGIFLIRHRLATWQRIIATHALVSKIADLRLQFVFPTHPPGDRPDPVL